MCALGRRAEDDRDHYGNKRLDLAGPLLGGLFRMVRCNMLANLSVFKSSFFLRLGTQYLVLSLQNQLFRKLTRDVRSYVQKVSPLSKLPCSVLLDPDNY